MAREVEDDETVNALRLAHKDLVTTVAQGVAPSVKGPLFLKTESGTIETRGGERVSKGASKEQPGR